jgi:hypothetical protein
MNRLDKDSTATLKDHLSKKPITYIELYEELYDHYASAYESSTTSLESVCNQLDTDFNDAYIAKLDRELPKKLNKSYRNAYWQEIKGFFRWPQFLITVLYVSTILLLVPYLGNKTVKLSLLIPSLSIPVTLMIFVWIKERQKTAKTTYKSAKLGPFIMYLNMGFTFFNFLNFTAPIFINMFNKEVNTESLLKAYPSFTSIVLLVISALTVAGFKVYQKKIKPQLA